MVDLNVTMARGRSVAQLKTVWSGPEIEDEEDALESPAVDMAVSQSAAGA